RADLTITVQQTVTGVVASATGSLNLSGLDFLGPPPTLQIPGMAPRDPFIVLGNSADVDFYTSDDLTLPFIGHGHFHHPTSTSGQIFGVIGGLTSGEISLIAVPTGYTSGENLTGTATWAGATYASLGVIEVGFDWDVEFRWGTASDQKISV